MTTLAGLNALGGVVGDDFDGYVIRQVYADGVYDWQRAAASGDNIYNADGTLTGSRRVTVPNGASYITQLAGAGSVYGVAYALALGGPSNLYQLTRASFGYQNATEFSVTKGGVAETIAGTQVRHRAPQHVTTGDGSDWPLLRVEDGPVNTKAVDFRFKGGAASTTIPIRVDLDGWTTGDHLVVVDALAREIGVATPTASVGVTHWTYGNDFNTRANSSGTSETAPKDGDIIRHGLVPGAAAYMWVNGAPQQVGAMPVPTRAAATAFVSGITNLPEQTTFAVAADEALPGSPSNTLYWIGGTLRDDD